MEIRFTSDEIRRVRYKLFSSTLRFIKSLTYHGEPDPRISLSDTNVRI